MRKIVYTKMDKHLILDKNIFYNIIIKNPKEYYEFISTLQLQIKQNEEYLFVLSKNNDTISLSKKSIIITDMFSIENIDRKTINILYKYIKKETTNDELTSILKEFNLTLNNFLLKLTNYIDIPIDFEDEVDIKDILKLVKATPELTQDIFLNKLIDFIKFMVEILNKDIFFLVNLSSFLSENDLNLFIKEMNLLEINIINIESKEYLYNLENCSTIIIDEDLCEYYK